MLVYAAHIPHSPLLLPIISRHKSRLFKMLRDAVHDISFDLHAQQVDTLVFISPVGNGSHNAHVIHYAPKYDSYLGDFGYFNQLPQYLGDVHTAFEIRRALCTKYPVRTTTPKNLDSASASASMQLQNEHKRFSLVPVTHGMLPIAELHSFGKDLREVLESTSKRVAVVSLGDMSRTTKKTETIGRKIDIDLIQHIHEYDTDTFLSHPDYQNSSFSVCAYRPLAILLGILDDMKYSLDVLRYEQKFGVGMMVGRFNFA